MTEPLTVFIHPGFQQRGEPGAEANRDQIYRLFQAVEFGAGDGTANYQLTNTDDLSSEVADFAASANMPMRDATQGEGTGHWFLSGQKMTVEVEYETIVLPANAAATIYVGIMFDPTIGTTTIADAVAATGQNVTSRLGIPIPASLQTALPLRGRAVWDIRAMGPNEQRLLYKGGIMFGSGGANEVNDKGLDGDPENTPKEIGLTSDFSGTDERLFGIYANVFCPDTNDVAIVDVRLKRVAAFIEGIAGENE